MMPERLIAAAIALCWALALPAAAAEPKNESIDHASPALMELAAEFRAFRSPLFRARTWRPTHRVSGVPNFADVKKSQIEGLARFRQALANLDPGDWPVHDQVDYLLLRSEMDDVWFEQHVLREVETNAGWYVEQAINGVAQEIPGVVPYSSETADAIIAAFKRTAAIVGQAQRTLILADAAPELARMGLRNLEEIGEKYAAGVELFSPHFPASKRRALKQAATEAARELEDYGRWIEQNLGRMQGNANVGTENMLWFFRRVNFVPWTREEILNLGEQEKNRFLMSVEIEETKNKGLDELTMPTTDEWIEWFRLTYLQTKYWLKENDLISFPDYVGESYLEKGAWQEPFGGVGNRPGLLGFASNDKPANRKFHDDLLNHGQIAPALVRWEMTGIDDQVRSFWDDPETPGGRPR